MALNRFSTLTTRDILSQLERYEAESNPLKKLVDMMCERMGNWDNSTVAVCHGDCLSDAEYAADLMRKKSLARKPLCISATQVLL